MLNSLSSLINNFLKIEAKEISDQNFDLMRRVIGSFENLKNNFNKNIEKNAFVLSPIERGFMTKFFTSIEFLLRRFGKIISMFQVIFQRYTLESQKLSNPKSFRNSYQKKLTGGTSDSKSISNWAKKSQNSSTSKYTMFSSKEMSSGRNNTGQILSTLSKDKKESIVIQHILKQQTSFWSNQLEQERAQSVPLIVCRICSQKIYADQEKKHTDLCNLKLKVKGQRKDKLKTEKAFLDISNKATEAILYLQKLSLNKSPKNTMMSTTFQFNRPDNYRQGSGSMKQDRAMFEAQPNPMSTTLAKHTFYDTTSVDSINGLPQKQKIATSTPFLKVLPLLNSNLRQFDEVNNIKRMSKDEVQNNLYQSSESIVQTPLYIRDRNYQTVDQKAPREEIKSNAQLIEEECKVGKKEEQMFETLEKVSVGLSKEKKVSRLSLLKSKGIKGVKIHGKVIKPDSVKKLDESQLQSHEEEKQATAPTVNLLSSKIQPPTQKLEISSQTSETQFSPIQIQMKKVLSQFAAIKQPLEEDTNPPVQNQIQQQQMKTNQTIKSSYTLTPTTGLNFLQEFQNSLDKSAGENSSDKKSQMAMIKRVSKQVVELLEHWKTMAQNSYYACIDSDSLQQNIMVQRLIKLQLENVSQMVSLPQLCEKSVKVGTDYINVLELKLHQLKEVIEIDKRLQSTVPKVPTKLDDELLADKKIKDAINHVLKGIDKQTFENALNRQSHVKGLTIKDLKGFLAKQTTLSQLDESEGKQSQLPIPFAADRRQSIQSNIDIRKSAWSYSTSMLSELLKNSRKQSLCSDQMHIQLEKTANHVLQKPIKRMSSDDLNKNQVFDAETVQIKVDSMIGLQRKFRLQSVPNFSNQCNIDPARALRKKQINQIRQLMKGQKPNQRESQFKRQDGTSYGFPIGKQNVQSDSDASSEEQKGKKFLLNVAESDEESTANNEAKINKNLLNDYSNIVTPLSNTTQQYQTTNYVVHSDIEPSCINYACRKAPDTDWSKQSSDNGQKGDILSQSDPDQEIKTRAKIEVIRQNLNQTCDLIKERNEKSSNSSLIQQGEDKRDSKKSSAQNYSQKSFREKGFDRLIQSKDKTLNESGFAKQNGRLAEEDFSQISSQMPIKKNYKSRKISNINLSPQVIGLGINQVMKEQHTEVFSQSGNSFDLEQSLTFLSGNEINQKESNFALGDDKVQLISFSPTLSSFAGLQQTFSQTPTPKLPYEQRKSQFSKPTDADINQTDVHSSQVQVTSNDVLHDDESNSISYHSSRETFIDNKINQNDQNKFLTSIFKAPQFMQISMQPKVASDSEISQGVEVNSSDFEQMKSNQNFGKFNDVNKQSTQFENVSVLLKNSSEVYDASVIDIFENIPQNLAENKTPQGLRINQINKTIKTESNEVKEGSSLFARVNNSKSAHLRRSSDEYQNQKNKPSRFLKENSKENKSHETRKSNKTEEYFAKSKSGSQKCSGHFGESQEEARSNSLSKMSMNTSYKEKKKIKKIKPSDTFARMQENDESGSDLSFKTALENFEEDNSPSEQLSPIEQPQSFEAMRFQSSANSISIQSRKVGSEEAEDSALLNKKRELINHKNITMDQVDANLPQTSSNRRKTSHVIMDSNYLDQFKKESKTEEGKSSVEKKKEVKGLIPTNLKTPSYFEFQSSSEETSDEVLNFKVVRFNSCVILPSEKACCQLDYQPESQKTKMSIQDFILLKTVASGAYGKVILARKKATKDLFAIKVLDKEMMVEKNVADFVMNERDILNKVDNDFIVRGVYTFQSKKYLYMVMEYMKGGDFGNLLENVHALNVETTKFYLAHVVLALEHLHSMGIVHRDLKPENMLIAADGHVKLTDFGLSEAGLRKKIQKTIMSKPNFKSKSEIFNINLDLAEQKLERNEITAKNLEIGLENKQACVDQDIAQQIGGIEGFLPHKEKELIEKIKPNYQSMKSNNKKTFNRPPINANINHKKTKSQSCVYDDMNKFEAFVKKEESVQSPSDTPIETKKPRILGTADYMAPEVIKGESVNYLLDFWSLGVIGYELLTGNLPFNDETPSKIFNNILEKEIEWPPVGQGEGQINPVAKDFLYKLLRRDPKERLGAKEGIKELKRHPFFLGTNWNNLINEPVPWLPQCKDDAFTFFPKAPTANDDVIKEIINEEQESLPSFGKLVGAQPFEQFDGISYASLKKINEREANKAMIWAQRQMKKKSKGERDASVSRFAESDSIVQVPQNMTIKDISAFMTQQQSSSSLNPFQMI